ncbi:octanoyltransferase LipM [Paenibacillus sp. J31TS4]|uniref:lipoate--protein ligase family protein n=1 Tax=Paenibacillus sp. J31TS4 TaxID=2807195 RepID=UPI001B22BF81|nr:biotin/lipoate A/B protein ligase family protein [Paenibacillus sp. J31TS4]GIP37922.1 octanoyltransferase LipM [Paenibacillus sp. J31TS4]
METTTWRFIRSGSGSPADNMAIDEAILIAHSEGRVGPTLRFYGWEPAAVSIGYFQKGSDVKTEEIGRQGLGFVRRPTGGRAVLHDSELTYSMIVNEEYPGLPKRVTEAYRVLSQGLLNGFLNLGLDAHMVNLASEEEKAKYDAMGSAACFDSPSWYELVVEGRKVAGSAQMRQRGVVLQHGSILLDLDIPRLFSLLTFRTDALRARLEESFSRKAVAINELLQATGRPSVGLAQVEEAFARGIEEGMGIRLVEEELTPYERELAATLAEEKYATDAWNARR